MSDTGFLKNMTLLTTTATRFMVLPTLKVTGLMPRSSTMYDSCTCVCVCGGGGTSSKHGACVREPAVPAAAGTKAAAAFGVWTLPGSAHYVRRRVMTHDSSAAKPGGKAPTAAAAAAADPARRPLPPPARPTWLYRW